MALNVPLLDQWNDLMCSWTVTSDTLFPPSTFEPVKSFLISRKDFVSGHQWQGRLYYPVL